MKSFISLPVCRPLVGGAFKPGVLHHKYNIAFESVSVCVVFFCVRGFYFYLKAFCLLRLLNSNSKRRGLGACVVTSQTAQEALLGPALRAGGGMRKLEAPGKVKAKLTYLFNTSR